MIYLVFSKAFDKMPHKDFSHGISGNVAAWIGEWLCDRKQNVVLNGEISRMHDVLCGVPKRLCSWTNDFLLMTLIK